MLVSREDMDPWPKSFMFLYLLLVGLQIGFGRAKPQFVPNYFDDCKPGVPVVSCYQDPCLTTICPLYPEARCRTNLCGLCKAEFLQDGKIVDCKKPYVPTWFDDCPLDTPVVQCHSDQCLGNECKYYPQATCRTNLCGYCRPEFVLNGKVIKCEPNNGTESKTKPKCPADKPETKCLTNPCGSATCKAFPSATCKPNYCGGCNAEFFVNDRKVNCVPKLASSIKQCPVDKPVVHCVLNPCSVAKCPTFPGAECRPNFCGGCNAEFFLGGVKINCALAVGQLTVPCDKTRYGCCVDKSTTAKGPNKEGCPGIYSTCSIERREAILSNHWRRYTPTCNLDGTFTAVQCWKAVQVCWCVDLEGKEKFETRSINRKPICSRKDAVLAGPSAIDCRVSPFGCCPDGVTSAIGQYNEGCPGVEVACWNSQFGCCPDSRTPADGPNFENCPRQSTKCEKDRDNVVRSSNGLLIGAYVPQCTTDGKYLKMQCHGSTGYCWCVNEDGNEFEGSRKRGKADCSAIVPKCRDKRKDCKGFLGYCTLFKAYMKKYCSKTCGHCSSKEMKVVTRKPHIEPTRTTSTKKQTPETKKPVATTAVPAEVITTQTPETTTTSSIFTPVRRRCGSQYGCCADGLIAAVGPNYLGCPVYKSICDMPAATGECRDSFRRYFYNQQQRRCEEFIYGGCGGNKNNYKTRGECEKKCAGGIKVKPDPGNIKVTTKIATRKQTTQPKTQKSSTTIEPTKATTTAAKVTTNEATTEKPTTKQTTATTLRPTTTRATTTTARPTTIPTTAPPVPECEIRRQLVLSASDESLRVALTRKDIQLPRCTADGGFSKIQCWAATGQCWCVDKDGNEIEGTKSSAAKPKCPKPAESSCKDARRTGCKYYASRKGYCKTYRTYMKKHCQKSCGLCDYEPKRPGCGSKYGCCKDGLTPATERDFGGCPVHDSVCYMQPLVGPCFAAMKRYFYNSTSNQCEQFTYGGCKGNMNNFDTLLGCKIRCMKDSTEAPTEQPTTVSMTLKLETTRKVTTTKAVKIRPTQPTANKTTPKKEQPTTEAATTIPEQQATTAADTTAKPIEVTTTEGAETDGPITRETTSKVATTVAAKLTTTESVTKAATTPEATTQELSTQEVKTQGTTTLKVSTQEPTTLEASTQESTTRQATTQKLTSVEPTTREPTTQRSTTHQATTQRATTQEVTTQETTTQEATTRKLTTREITTPTPPIQEVTTQEATTQRATTQEVTTQETTTQEATTRKLTTREITTSTPPIQEVTTQEATTQKATTQEATTRKVTTIAPTTGAVKTTTGTPPIVITISPTTAKATRRATSYAPTTVELSTQSDVTTKILGIDTIINNKTTIAQTTGKVLTTSEITKEVLSTTVAATTIGKQEATTKATTKEVVITDATTKEETTGKPLVITTAGPKLVATTVEELTTAKPDVITTGEAVTTGEAKEATNEQVIVRTTQVPSTEKPVTTAPQETTTTLPPPLVVTDDQFGFYTTEAVTTTAPKTTVEPTTKATTTTEASTTTTDLPTFEPVVITDEIIDPRTSALPVITTTAKSIITTESEKTTAIPPLPEITTKSPATVVPTTSEPAALPETTASADVATTKQTSSETDSPTTKKPTTTALPAPGGVEEATTSPDLRTEAPVIPTTIPVAITEAVDLTTFAAEFTMNATRISKTNEAVLATTKPATTTPEIAKVTTAELRQTTEQELETTEAIVATKQPITLATDAATLETSTAGPRLTTDQAAVETKASTTKAIPQATTIGQEVVATTQAVTESPKATEAPTLKPKQTTEAAVVETQAPTTVAQATTAVPVVERTVPPTEKVPIETAKPERTTKAVDAKTKQATTKAAEQTTSVESVIERSTEPATEPQIVVVATTNAVQTTEKRVIETEPVKTETARKTTTFAPEEFETSTLATKKPQFVTTTTKRGPTRTTEPVIEETEASTTKAPRRTTTAVSEDIETTTRIATDAAGVTEPTLQTTVAAVTEPLSKCLQMRSRFLTQLANRDREAPLPHMVGLFIPECDNDGQFERIQCWEMLRLCWCVGPHDGKELSGSRVNTTSGRKPDCFRSQLTECERARIKVLKTLTKDGEDNSKSPGPEIFVPRCDKTGNFEEVQCNAIGDKCWCVDKKTGNLTDGVGIPDNPICVKAKETQCQMVRNLAKKLAKTGFGDVKLGPFIPKCEEDGSYSEIQCLESVGDCWCVNENGEERMGTRAKGIPNCNKKKKPATKCEKKREESLKDALVVGGKLIPPPGTFLPTCEADGTFSKVQCNQFNGECWCVDKEGTEEKGTRTSDSKPTCERPLSKCEKLRQESLNSFTSEVAKNASISFVPRCDEGGNFTLVQCDHELKVCWCVDQEGIEMDHTRTSDGQPDCKRRALTTCEKQAVAALEDINLFMPECDENGTYKQLQCQEGSCWCVNKNGVEREGTRIEGQPNCTIVKLTKCERERKQLNEINKIEGIPLVGAFVPKCNADGSYAEAQCHGSTGYCWCVDKQGSEVAGTRYRFGTPQCKRLLAKKNLTDCEYRSRFILQQHGGRKPDWLFVPKCEVDGSYSKQQCNEKYKKCWCVNEDGRMTRWVGKNQTAQICSKVVTTDCERQRQKAFNSAFMINKRFPLLPLGTSMPVCNEDGSFKMMQCHEGYCWCVDGQGNKVAERTKRFEKPECERLLAGNKTDCETKRETVLTPIRKENGYYVTQCKTNGEYERKQCNDVTGQCWCVDKEGRMTEWAKKDEEGKLTCTELNANLTKCQLRQRAVYKKAIVLNNESPVLPLGVPLPECNADGSFKQIQCNEGFCWCVDDNGQEITHTLSKFARPQCNRISAGNLTKCEKLKQAAIEENSKSTVPKRFGFKCDLNGDFAKRQCNANTGYCWCVNKKGMTIAGSVTFGKLPSCTQDEPTECRKQRQEVYDNGNIQANGIVAPLLGAFLPICKDNGEFEPIQCHGSIGYCWCVYDNGTEIPDTRGRTETPDCKKKKLTPCQKQEQDVYKTAKSANGRPLLPPGTFVPKCKENGDFEEIQCHGSTGYCWCVDRDGKKLPGTSKRSKKPQCARIIAGNLTKCEINLLSQLGDTPDGPVPDRFIIECNIDGSFVPLQCDDFTNACWCVNEIGATIDGSETKEGKPDCSPRNLTSCQQKRQDVYNEAGFIDGRTTLPPDIYLPKCKENGEFEVLQCHGFQGACWCVDQTGKNVHGLAYDKKAVQDDGHCKRILAGNLTKCESYKEDKFGHAEPPTDVFFPICNVDGSYHSIQCDGFRGECWCVDEEGRFIYGTEVQAARPDCSPRNFTKCELQRQGVLNSFPVSAGKPTPLLGAFMPKCKADGSFVEAQCHTSTGYCWCVDEDGNKRKETEVQFRQPDCKANAKTKCQLQRDKASGSLSTENGKAGPLVGAFVPQCKDDGSFKDIQCHPSTGYCWCVDKEGNKREGTETRFSQPECKQRNLTKCEQQLQDAYKRAKLIDGTRVFPPGMFVPDCDKKDGSFSSMQCHGSTGSCFCVNENGSEVPHTRVRFRKPQCQRILAGNLTKCERERIQSTFSSQIGQLRRVPTCKVDGSYSEIQCDSSVGYCWCLDKNGEKRPETETLTGEPICSDTKVYSECEKRLNQARKQATEKDGKLEFPLGLFVPSCKDDGSFRPLQCHGSTGYCFCVNPAGKEITHSRVRSQVPECKRLLAGNLTKCELERMQEHLPGRFNPRCEVDGRYSEIQCHGSTGYCWCVNENGEKMPKTEVRGPEPKCGGGALTKCQAFVKDAESRASENEGEILFPEGEFVPKCTEDGGFEPTQCQQRDSKNYCWCVDENGVEISLTKTHLGRPNCTRLIANDLTQCETRRKENSEKLTKAQLTVSLVPQCNVDGSFTSAQCWKGECWCVNKDGKMIEGTRTEDQPDCSAVAQVQTKPPVKTTPKTAEEVVITQAPTTAELIVTTQAPTTAKVVVTTQAPTTAEEVVTTQAPTTAEEVVTTQAPTTAEEVVTTQAPTTAEEVVTTQAPTTAEEVVTTKAPTTIEEVVTTQAPTTAKVVVTTQAPTTAEEVVTTQAPTTAGKIVTTQAPTTAKVVVTTQAPTTAGEVVTTQAPTTAEEVVTTQAPTTAEEVVTTQAPTTAKVVVTTQAPTTAGEVVTTQAPTTAEEVVTTQAPTTAEEVVTTQAPTTAEEVVTTQAPTTAEEVVTTQAPTTAELIVTTQAPTTAKVVVTTQAPTTAEEVVTTQAPTTAGKIVTTQAPTTAKVVVTTQAPTTAEEVVTTQAPTTAGKIVTTQAPTTEEEVVTTQAPTTAGKVVTTQAPTTAEVVVATQAPTTVGKVVTTQAPTTAEKVVTTQALTTADEVVTTQAPTTAEGVVTTQAPTTAEEVVTTQAPTTAEEVVTTQAPTTAEEVVTTQAPTTAEEVVTTQAPTTAEEVVTTQAPTTAEEVVTTQAPTTAEEVVTTQAPTTAEEVVTTQAPTTAEEVVTTQAPTTAEEVITTQAPTTAGEVVTTQARTTAEKVVTTQARTTAEKVVTTQAPTTAEAVTTQASTTAEKPTTREPTTKQAVRTTKPFIVTTSTIATEKPTVSEITAAIFGNKSTTTNAAEQHVSACFLPKDPGPCKGRELRFAYDKELKDCVPFVYGGCRGNVNNFASAEECVSQCRERIEQLVTKAPVTKKDGTKAKKIPGCNSQHGCCDDYVTPAEGPNQAGCPEYQSRCEYPPAQGPCKAKITRWYYNARLQNCNSFMWGGCPGNKNNFVDYKACMKQCKGHVPSAIKEGGEEGTIELQTKFLPGCVGEYGCCDDGVSPAKGPNQQGCPPYESICHMPAVKGYCKDGNIIRWHYNKVASRCDQFRYSGCGGNENNFETPNQCAEKCQIGAPKCIDKIGHICGDWQKKGYCLSRWRHMSVYCRKTCDFCNVKKR